MNDKRKFKERWQWKYSYGEASYAPMNWQCAN